MPYADDLVCAPWTTDAKVRGVCSKLDGASGDEDDLITEAIDIASNILYMASGRQFPGTCTQILRPAQDCQCGCWTDWYDEWPGAVGTGCGCCNGSSRLDLGLWPITSITEVDVAGTILGASEYHLEDYRVLVRTPQAPDYETRYWPTCQYRDRPKGAPLTFAVTVQYGKTPPPMGVRAASKLACEYIALCTGQPCSLPQNIRSISRQGASIDLNDPTELRQLGLFGIPEVDVFLTTYNPNKLQSASFVWSPDLIDNARWT